MPVAEIFHPAMRALPDVILAVDPQTLRVVDVNHAEAFGHRREALASLALDALIDVGRDQLLELVQRADGRLLDVRLRTGSGGVAKASARAAASAGATAVPCVLVAVREATDGAALAEEIEAVRAALEGALDRLARLADRRPPASPAPELSLEQYVSLCVEAELDPANVAAIEARYGVTGDAARAELHGRWKGRLGADAALAAQWAGLYRHYREWFAAQRARGDAGPVSEDSNAETFGGGERTTAPSARKHDAALPFVATPHAAAPPVAAARETALPSARVEDAPDDVRETIAVGDLVRRGEALPFKGADEPLMSVDQFAALSVELELHPEQKKEILARYGVSTETAWRACQSGWTARLVSDGELRLRWVALTTELKARVARR